MSIPLKQNYKKSTVCHNRVETDLSTSHITSHSSSIMKRGSSRLFFIFSGAILTSPSPAAPPGRPSLPVGRTRWPGPFTGDTRGGSVVTHTPFRPARDLYSHASTWGQFDRLSWAGREFFCTSSVVSFLFRTENIYEKGKEKLLVPILAKQTLKYNDRLL